MVLLAVLRTHGNAYGVSISREITESGGCDVALASIYAALERLESKGFVKSERGEPTAERGGKARTFYHVTAAGMKELRSAHATFMRLSAGLKELKV